MNFLPPGPSKTNKKHGLTLGAPGTPGLFLGAVPGCAWLFLGAPGLFLRASWALPGGSWLFLGTPEPFLGAMPGCAWLCLGVPARSWLYCLPQNMVSLCERYANTMRNLCENTPTQPEPAPPTPALVTPALPILRQATPLHPRPAPTMALLPQAPVMTMP